MTMAKLLTPRLISRTASVCAIVAASAVATACAPIAPLATEQPVLAPVANPDAEVVTLPATSACGPAAVAVSRVVVPEHVLFATASDDPAPSADGLLDMVADRVRRSAPGTELTVLGHTDAIGPDAYNIDLSRRRARRVLHEMVARGLDPDRLSMVAIGARQPVADNATAEGRARNRRVELLISGCLAANLEAVRARPSPDVAADTQVDVLRLGPAAASGLAAIGRISLQPLGGDDRPSPATVAPPRSARTPALPPPVSLAKPAPAPHYEPRTLSPEAQHNPLGPAVPF